MMRFLVLLLLAPVLLAGCGASRVLAPPPVGALSFSSVPSLKAEIDRLLPDSLFPPSNLGIKIISLETHEVLYSLNERMLFNPASNQKLFTSSAALVTLGPSYPFTTVVAVDTASRTIHLRGNGDPLLSTADLDSLAQILAPIIGHSHVWTLAVDISFFDDLYWGDGWTWDEEPAAYGMFVSPLILNNNVITVRVLPGIAPGAPASVSTEPVTSYVKVEAGARTAPDSVGGDISITRKWRERSNTISVTGTIRKGGRPSTERLSVWKPELYAGTVFAERLQSLGIQIEGVRVDTLPATAPEVARFQHTLDTVVTFFNKESDNLSGEAILKTLGALNSGAPGTARKGIHAVHSLLARWGIDTSSVSIADGSGLSRYNLTSPAAIITLLDHMYRERGVFDAFHHSLPVAGIDGTIGGRMRNTTASGNLRAKTGTLAGVTALSGYVRSADGEALAFSILMQHFTGSARRYREVQDKIGVLLSQYSRQ